MRRRLSVDCLEAYGVRYDASVLLQKDPEVVRHGLGIGVALGRILGERPVHDALELWHPASIDGQRRSVRPKDSEEDRFHLLSLEGILPGEQTIQNDSDAEYVGAAVEYFRRSNLLGRHVVGGSQNYAVCVGEWSFNRATPKSIIFTAPESVIKILAGLMSR